MQKLKGKIQKADDKEFKAQAALYKRKIAEEKLVAREKAKVEGEKRRKGRLQSELDLNARNSKEMRLQLPKNLYNNPKEAIGQPRRR